MTSWRSKKPDADWRAPPLGDDPLAHDALIEALCRAAEMVGLLTVRPPLLALRAARAHAALAVRTRVNTEDAAAAVRLVLSPRAPLSPRPSSVARGVKTAPTRIQSRQATRPKAKLHPVRTI